MKQEEIRPIVIKPDEEDVLVACPAAIVKSYPRNRP
jgi:hypothetical protein